MIEGITLNLVFSSFLCLLVAYLCWRIETETKPSEEKSHEVSVKKPEGRAKRAVNFFCAFYLYCFLVGYALFVLIQGINTYYPGKIAQWFGLVEVSSQIVVLDGVAYKEEITIEKGFDGKTIATIRSLMPLEE